MKRQTSQPAPQQLRSCVLAHVALNLSARCVPVACFDTHTQVAALVFYILCETINKNQFVLNFVVCIVLLAMDFWTVRGSASQSALHTAAHTLHSLASSTVSHSSHHVLLVSRAACGAG